MQIYCQNSLEYTFDPKLYDLGPISVPCNVVIQGKDSILNYVAGEYVKKEYYKEYRCGLFDCSLESLSPLVYVSQHSKNYWSQWFYYSLFASLILIALMFLLMEKKKNIFINVGMLMMISSLPLLFLNWLVSSFNFADILFSKANVIFWVVFILGTILIMVGIGLKFWKFSSEIEENSKGEKVSEKEVKEVVKEKVKVKGK